MANSNPSITSITRDVSGTGGARRSVQQQFKKAGDVSKQRAETERSQRQFQLSEKQRQIQRTADEFRQDVQLAQEAAREDLAEYESDVRTQWRMFSDALQKARDRAADNLQKFSTDTASEEAISGVFSGLNNIISGTLSLGSGKDTGGLIGQAIQRRRTVNQLEQDLISEVPTAQFTQQTQNVQPREELTAFRNIPPSSGTVERAPFRRNMLIGRGNTSFGNLVMGSLGLNRLNLGE